VLVLGCRAAAELSIIKDLVRQPVGGDETRLRHVLAAALNAWLTGTLLASARISRFSRLSPAQVTQNSPTVSLVGRDPVDGDEVVQAAGMGHLYAPSSSPQMRCA